MNWLEIRRRRGGGLALLVLLVSLSVSSRASGDVIAPGQESILADMLGKGASLPGGCAWAGAAMTGRFARLPERVLCGQRLLREHIERRAGEMS